ncbi:MAG: OsmC family protein [Bacteroidetes bacterium]|jgi:peroxiredoxin-like protein|nr:OsmC family protein [Bacteroidota bacterium]
MDSHDYSLSLTWTGDRKGRLHSDGLAQSIEVATPLPFPKGIEGVWSPEHLFTASALSCFMTTFLAIAEFNQMDIEQFDCKAIGTLDKVEGKFLMTHIALHPLLRLKDTAQTDKAERLMRKAKEACLISRSMLTKVELVLP